MRNVVCWALLDSCLLLGFAHRAIAADKIKIEVAESTMTIGLVPYTSRGTPEQIRTNCSTIAGVHCTSTVIQATNSESGLMPEILMFEVKAILPDGSHAQLSCFPNRGNKKCKPVRPTDFNSRYDSAACYMQAVAAFASTHDNPRETKTCTTKNVGVFSAKRDKDQFLISSHDGKLEYRVTGSW